MSNNTSDAYTQTGSTETVAAVEKEVEEVPEFDDVELAAALGVPASNIERISPPKSKSDVAPAPVEEMPSQATSTEGLTLDQRIAMLRSFGVALLQAFYFPLMFLHVQ